MTAERTEDLFVAEFGFPVLKVNLELKFTFLRRAFAVEVSVLVIGNRHRDAGSPVEFPQRADRFLKHGVAFSRER